jgi:hypothetical protein
MGQTLDCEATFKRQRSSGRAELETDYLLFRGDFRVKLPFGAISSVSARDGVLTLKAAEGTLILLLGDRAGTWAAAIKTPKTRLDKIGIKPRQRVSLDGVKDPAFVDELKAAGADVSHRLRTASDVVFVRIESAADLKKIARAGASLVPDGALWAIRRKGVAEASEALTMAAGKAAGLVDVKVVRFSETHTAEKFVIPKSRRRG